MALTYSIKDRGSAGDLAFRVVDITLGAGDYLAGGYVLDPQQLGFGKNGIIYNVITGIIGGFFTEFVPATNALKFRDASGGVGAATPETANALAALNGLVVRVMAFGKGHG